MMKRTLTLAAAALLACGLSACSRSDPDPAPADNRVMEPAEEPAPEVNSSYAELPSPESTATQASDANAAAAASPPAPAPAPDEQMMDDASATGMTARSSRGGDQPSAEPTSPEQSEPK
jgi:hypothetical protein